jgi:hypothetical protein
VLDVATLRQWVGRLGFEATNEGGSTLRLWPRGPGSDDVPPFFAQCTPNWLVLSILPVLPPERPIPRRRLLERSREMRVAKFALGEGDLVVLCAELPTESLDYEEFEDAALRMVDYVTRFRRDLLRA